MSSRTVVPAVGALLLVLALGGCPADQNPFFLDPFTITVLPPDQCGTVRFVPPGDSVHACLQVLLGGSTGELIDITVEVSAPPGLDAKFAAGRLPLNLGTPSETGDFDLYGGQSVSIPVTVGVATTAAPRVYTVSFRASCCDLLVEFASFDLEVFEDGDPPLITIRQPEEASTFEVRPIALDATVSDDGRIDEVTYGWNGAEPVAVTDLGDGRSVRLQAEWWRPLLGSNTLDVFARDVTGNESTAEVTFEYGPTGLCTHFEMALRPEVLDAVPGGSVGTLVSITPLAGWTGRVGLATSWFGARGPILGAADVDVDGPVTALFSGSLLSDQLPGESRQGVVRAQDRDTPETACEIVLGVNVAAPGTVQAPVVSIQSPTDGEVFDAPTVGLVGDVTDDGTIISVWRMIWSESEKPPLVETFSGSSTDPVAVDEVLTFPAVGEHLISVFALDDGGRLGSGRVIVTRVPPAPSIVEVEVTATGQGRVHAPDPAVALDCVSTGATQTCTATFEDVAGPGTLELVAEPASGWELDSWGRDCQGETGLTCTLTYTPADNVSLAADAVFVQPPAPPMSPIVFQSTRDANREIYMVNPDRTGLTRITTNPADDREPAWSPDGTRIAFVTDRDGNREIYTMAADGTDPVRLTTLTGSSRRPAYSPDGTRIAFDNDGDGDDEIFVMNVDGTGVTQLTANAIDFDQGPSWSPSSTEIVFTSFRDGNDDLYVMNADGTGQRRLVDTGEHDWQPDWSPDGTRIVFSRQSLAGGPDEIFVVNADGITGLRQLTFNAATDEEPTWSPDGNWIAFTSDRGGNQDIYIMTADGQNVMQVTTDPADDSRPSWVH